METTTTTLYKSIISKDHSLDTSSLISNNVAKICSKVSNITWYIFITFKMFSTPDTSLKDKTCQVLPLATPHILCYNILRNIYMSIIYYIHIICILMYYIIYVNILLIILISYINIIINIYIYIYIYKKYIWHM